MKINYFIKLRFLNTKILIMMVFGVLILNACKVSKPSNGTETGPYFKIKSKKNGK